MFVNSNKLSAIKKYVQEKLKDAFSSSEIKFMFNSMVSQRLGIDNGYLLLDDASLSESDLLFFRAIVKRLLTGEPFQQIIGFTEFYGLEMKVSTAVLTPRPETEELVHQIVTDLKKDNDSPIIIDVCTGSGCIALALKKAFPNGTVIGMEKSTDALKIAQLNADHLKLNIDFQQCDVLTDDWQRTDKVDVIVSNPPYVTWAEKDSMSKTVIDFEPSMALFVMNDDPLLFYRKIASKALELLRKEGRLYFEINEKYGTETVILLEEMNFHSVQMIQDLQGKDRMIVATK